MSDTTFVKLGIDEKGHMQQTPVDAVTIKGDPYRERERMMRELRKIMFTRGHQHDLAFQPLTPVEQQAINLTIDKYRSEGSFVIAAREEEQAFHTLSMNHVAQKEITPPQIFCETADHVAKKVVQHVTPVLDRETTLWVLPWRAGLVLGAKAAEAGYRRFFHVGASRDEETLETRLYYTSEIDVSHIENIVYADPMLATGNTVIKVAKAVEEALRKFGRHSQLQTYALSIIAAPEGIDHILQACPTMKVISGKLDLYLDHRGFIVIGLGDFGDRYWVGLTEKHISHWQAIGLLSQKDVQALRARMCGHNQS